MTGQKKNKRNQDCGWIQCEGSLEKEKWVSLLLEWFRKNHRWMPWREESTPYRRWISEIMLQQTRVETVIPYFNRFINRFPTIESLADASEDEVLKMWEGLGYYSRARHVRQAAQVIMKEHGGFFPDSQQQALTLPGIGPYSSAAILSMAYGVPLPSVDGNVMRVFCRLTAWKENVLDPATVKKVRTALQTIIPCDSPGSFNEALMELGAVVCVPLSPNCPSCPLTNSCHAFRFKLTHCLPVRIKKGRVVKHHYLVFWLNGSGEKSVAVRKNPPRGLLGGLWAFPMVEISRSKEYDPTEEGFSQEKQNQSVLEAEKQWGITIDGVRYRQRLSHQFSHQHWTMDVVEASTVSLPDDFVWVNREHLLQLAFPEAYQKVIRLMEERPASI